MTDDEAREILNSMLASYRILFLNNGEVSIASGAYTEREIEALLIGLRKHKVNLLVVDPTQFIGGNKE